MTPLFLLACSKYAAAKAVSPAEWSPLSARCASSLAAALCSYGLRDQLLAPVMPLAPVTRKQSGAHSREPLLGILQIQRIALFRGSTAHGIAPI